MLKVKSAYKDIVAFEDASFRIKTFSVLNEAFKNIGTTITALARLGLPVLR